MANGDDLNPDLDTLLDREQRRGAAPSQLPTAAHTDAIHGLGAVDPGQGRGGGEEEFFSVIDEGEISPRLDERAGLIQDEFGIERGSAPTESIPTGATGTRGGEGFQPTEVEDVTTPNRSIVDTSGGLAATTENLSAIRSAEEAKISQSQAREQPTTPRIPETPAQRIELRASGGKVDAKQARLARFAEEQFVRNRVHRDRTFLLSPEDVERTVNSINAGISGEDVRGLSREEVSDITPLLGNSAVGRDVLRRSSLELSQAFNDFLENRDTFQTTADVEDFVSNATKNPLISASFRSLVDGLKTTATGKATEFGKRLTEGDKNRSESQKNFDSVRFNFLQNALPGETFTEHVNANYRMVDGKLEELSLAEKEARAEQRSRVKAIGELLGGIAFTDMSKPGKDFVESQLSPEARATAEKMRRAESGSAVEISAEEVAKLEAETARVIGELMQDTQDAMADLAVQNESPVQSYLDRLRNDNGLQRQRRSLQTSEEVPYNRMVALAITAEEIFGVSAGNREVSDVIGNQLAILEQSLESPSPDVRPEIREAYEKRLAQVNDDLAELGRQEQARKVNDDKIRAAKRVKQEDFANKFNEGRNIKISSESIEFIETPGPNPREYGIVGENMRRLADYANNRPADEQKEIFEILIQSAGGTNIMGTHFDLESQMGRLGVPKGAEQYFVVRNRGGVDFVEFRPMDLDNTGMYPDKAFAQKVSSAINRNGSEMFKAAMDGNTSEFVRRVSNQANWSDFNLVAQALRSQTEKNVQGGRGKGKGTGEFTFTAATPDELLDVEITIGAGDKLWLPGEKRSIKRAGTERIVEIIKRRKNDDTISDMLTSDSADVRVAGAMGAIANHIVDQRIKSERVSVDATRTMQNQFIDHLTDIGETSVDTSFDSMIDYMFQKTEELRVVAETVVQQDNFQEFDRLTIEASKLRDIMAQALESVNVFNEDVQKDIDAGIADYRGGAFVDGHYIRERDPIYLQEIMQPLVNIINDITPTVVNVPAGTEKGFPFGGEIKI